MKKLIISGTGFPGTTKTLQHLQDGIAEPLSGIAQWIGDFTILSGVQKIGSTNNYTAGYVAFNGEIIPFKAGTQHAKVSLITTTQTAQYDNGNASSLPAYQSKNFQFGEISGATAVFNFPQFKRFFNWKPESLKLAGIEQNAQKNVLPNWLENNGILGVFIKNKPFRKIKVMSGTAIIPPYGDTTYIYPPNGFHVSNLQGITVYYTMPSGAMYHIYHSVSGNKINCEAVGHYSNHPAYVYFLTIWMTFDPPPQQQQGGIGGL